MSKVPRTVTLLYLGTAHVALALACALAAWWPHAVAGFFYHSWMVALVHLVTLGWITFSIFGAIYIVGPIALRMEMRVGRMDYVAYACALTGLVGMVAHFWIEEYAGMAWSAGVITLGAVYTTGRIVAGIWRAPVQHAVRLHIVLACVNFWLAALMGILIGIDKATPILPGFILSNVFAHAHLAAIGWATMMVVGVGYRLLPMVLPSKMPTGRAMYASAVLLEVGVLGLFTTLVLQRSWAWVFGCAIAGGLAVFAGHVVWMVRHPAPPPADTPRPDFGVLHVSGAAVSFVAAVAIGLLLLVVPPSTEALRAAAAYGALGLVGFLGQMVVAMETRLLPMATWFWMFARSGAQAPPPAPQLMRDRSLQVLVFAGWTIGVPALAAGLGLESALLVAIGAWTLLASVAIATIDHVWVIGFTGRGQA